MLRTTVTNNLNVDQVVYCAPQSWDTKRGVAWDQNCRVSMGGRLFSLQPLASWQGNILTGKVYIHMLLCTVTLHTCHATCFVYLFTNSTYNMYICMLTFIYQSKYHFNKYLNYCLLHKTPIVQCKQWRMVSIMLLWLSGRLL